MKNPITTKRIFFFVLVLSLSLLMAACGSTDNEGTTDNVAAPEQGAAATEVIETPVADTGSDVVQPEVGATETTTEENTQANVGQDQSAATTESNTAETESGTTNGITTEEDQTQAETVAEPTVGTTESDMAETEPMTGTEVAQQDQTQQGEMIPPTGAINADQLSTLLDFEVWNRNNEQVGDVDDMIIDMESSQIEYVVVGVGGFLGIGEKSIAVPWSTFEMNQMQPAEKTGAQDTGTEVDQVPLNVLFLDADQDRLEQAPEANLDTIGAPSDETLQSDTPTFKEQESEIRAFWGSDAMSNDTMTSTSEVSGTSKTEAQMTETGQQQLILASELLDADIISSLNQPMEDQQKDTMNESAADQATSDNQDVTVDSQANANATAEQVGNVEEIGNVEDIVIDHNTGQVKYILVSLNNDVALNDQNADTTASTTAGTADTTTDTADTQAQTKISNENQLVPVPLDALAWNAEEQALTLTGSHTLQDAPTITFDEFLNDVERTWESAVNDYWTNDTLEQNNN